MRRSASNAKWPLLVLILAGWPTLSASAADEGQPRKADPKAAGPQGAAPEDAAHIAGILIDRKDNWISVRADGDDEPVKYLLPAGPDAKLAETLKTLFPASRVELTYRADGPSRTLIQASRPVLKPAGTVTGQVAANHGWWIEVKPAKGVPDAYACNFPFDKHPETMEQLKALEIGDSVTIHFNSDFERHRIQTLHKNASSAHHADAAATGGHAPGKGNTAAGILIDKNADWLSVKADGEDEPVKYLTGGSDKKVADALKGIFNASRVQLTYATDGDARRLVSIKKQVLKQTGTVTGTVVKVYNDFWVEVKPKSGPADAYAPGANWNDKEFMALLRGLQPGDSVTIKFFTDFERHRIESLRKHPGGSPGSQHPSSDSKKSE